MPAHREEFAEHAWAKCCPFCYQVLCTARLNPNVLDSVLLSVLEHVFVKALPDCSHEHPSLISQNHAWSACFFAELVHQGIR